MKKIINILPLLLFVLGIKAQEKTPLNTYQDLISKSQELSADNKFNEAYNTLNKLNKNDSNYINSFSSLTYYLLNDDERDSTKYDEVIKIAQEGLDNKKITKKYYLYINMASALFNQKKYREAIKVYDKALKTYSKNHHIYYSKGLSYEELEEYGNAAKMYKKAIIYNPYHASSHLKLGYLAYRSDKIAEALMCMNFYLLIKPEGASSLKVLEALNTVVSSKIDDDEKIDIQISKDDESFEDIDLLINNHISISDKYKVKNKINIALVKQNHLLLEQLKDYESEDEDGFFSQKYVPFYNWIRDNKQFDNFIYTICYSAENKTYRKILDSKTNDVKEFIPKSFNQIKKNFRKNKLVLDNKKQTAYCFYNDSYQFQGIGTIKNDKMVGYWEIYSTENGSLSGIGHFDENEKKTGEWAWYREDGTIDEKANYTDGKLDGIKELYYDNGQVYYNVIYKDGEVEGDYNEYNRNGALITTKTFKDSELDGEMKTYYRTGKKYPNFVIPYSNGKINGNVIQYFPTGEKSLIAEYTDGKKEGSTKEFYSNGQVYSEGNYKEHNIVGEYKEYFDNGTLKTTGNYEEGNRIGAWKYYHRNGKIATESVYKSGKLVDKYNDYDVDGKLYCTYDYKRGNIYAFTFFDKKGNVLHTDDKKSGTLNFVGFNPNGNKRSEGLYDIKGGKDGEWKFYDNNKLLTNKSSYKDGLAHGESNSYYNNGTKKIEKWYTNDTLEGYYTDYFESGELSNEGWYKNDLQEGVWKSYYPNKRIDEVNYFNSNNLNGVQLSYSVSDSSLYSKLTYENGILTTEEYYNDKNEIYLHVEIPTEEASELKTHYTNKAKKNVFKYAFGIKNGKYISYYQNGTTNITGEYLNGNRHGEWIWYYKNGNIDTKYTYIYGDIEGDYFAYHKNGKLSKTKHYELGTLTGETKEYNDKGILTGTSNYYNGEVHGKRYFYSEGGYLQLIREYHNGELIGYSYHDKNKKELPMIPITNETAKITSYFDNGKKARDFEFENGNFEGKYDEFYYSGQMYQTQTYKNTNVEGEIKTYYQSGKIKEVENYLGGYLNGKSYQYHENGKLKKETDYIYDLKHGMSIEYSKEGNVITKEKYFNNLLILEKQ